MASAVAADLYDCGGGISAPEGRSRRLRALLLPRRDSSSHAHPDQNPLLFPPPPVPLKKKGFASVAFRGLGCTTSSAQVYAPAASAGDAVAAAAVRSSADWQAKSSRSSRRKKVKVKKKERDRPPISPLPLPLPLPPHQHQQHSAGNNRRSHASAVVTASDMWCAPGIGFDASVDCVAPHYQHQHHQPSASRGRGAAESERLHREDPYVVRQVGNLEQLSSLLDSPPSALETPLFGSDLILTRHLHRSRRIRRSPGGLDELMMFQARLLLGEMDEHDRYSDLRLDVDNMTYEELLELGDRIGYVNTGLREEEIYRHLRKMKHSIFTSSTLQTYTELERKCSICQEEYEVNDEVGKLECGHSYHTYCIKQWLLRKNACPVCKATVAKG